MFSDIGHIGTTCAGVSISETADVLTLLRKHLVDKRRKLPVVQAARKYIVTLYICVEQKSIKRTKHRTLRWMSDTAEHQNELHFSTK